MSAPIYGIKNLDHHGLVAGFCQELGIAAIIDKSFPSAVGTETHQLWAAVGGYDTQWPWFYGSNASYVT